MRHLAISLACSLLAGTWLAEGEALFKDPLENSPHEYRPPGPGDSRSPCPGMNALANHGYINRSGRKITPIAAVVGCFKGMGVSPEVCGISAVNSLRSAPGPFALSFDLEHLQKHNGPIEHDVSFSREDVAIGDSNTFNATIWQSVLDELGNSDTVTTAALARAKDKRVGEQRAKNPKLEYDKRAAILGGAEVGMLLTTLGFRTGSPKLSWVRSLFEQERLPTHLGWKPIPGSNNLVTSLIVGMRCLKAQSTLPEELRRKLQGPAKLSSVFLPHNRNEFMLNLGKLVGDAGFDSSNVDKLRIMMDKGLI